jgi:guanylate kinase
LSKSSVPISESGASTGEHDQHDPTGQHSTGQRRTGQHSTGQHRTGQQAVGRRSTGQFRAVGAAVATPVHSRLTVLSGPSGVGKSTVVAELRRTSPQIWLSVSVTTRKPRPGEVDGRDYYFIGDGEFDRLIADDELLEWACPHGTHRSGTPRRPVEENLKAGVPCLLEIDLAGARQVKQAAPDARMVFLAPPSWDELVRRLTDRGTEPPEVIARRLATAKEELAAADEFDVTLVNSTVTEVCRQLVALMAQ